MWHLLEKISEQVTKYSTFLGQLWYILVFVFRLIVVVTIGGAVYGDEQSAFQCSAKVEGCANMCYNQFAKISHIRFWAFQLLAVATPTVFFHFYSMYMSGEIQKLKNVEEQLKQLEDGEGDAFLGGGNEQVEKDFRKMSKRKKSVGNVKVRRIYSGNELKEIPYTNKIHYAYYFSIVVRLIAETVFIYLAYNLFSVMQDSETNANNSSPFYFLWMSVPEMYTCRLASEGVRSACNQHVAIEGGYVPCFVSRPFEKTVFLRYMNILSAMCFVVSVLELIVVTSRRFWKKRRPATKHLFHKQPQRAESVFYSSAPPPTRFSDHPSRYTDPHHIYPSLGVPVRLTSNFPKENSSTEKKVQISDLTGSDKALSSTASVKSYI